MAERGKGPELDGDDREAAVREWERQSSSSIIADKTKQRGTGIVIAIACVIACVVVYYFKNVRGSEQEKKNDDAELTIAERTEVPPLDPTKAVEGSGDTKTEETSDENSQSAEEDAVEQQLKIERAKLELQREEEARRLLEARRRSDIMPGNTFGGEDDEGEPQSEGATNSEETGMLGLEHKTQESRGAQDANSRFARSVSGSGVPVSKVSRIEGLDCKILQGKVIRAIVQPRAISDLPGTICARVQRDVYGEQGRMPLIPWGSKVCGVYSSDIRKGQERLFPIWNTLRTPAGDEVTIDSVGGDQLGSAGMGGVVDNHFAQIFGTSALISIIGAGASNAGVDSDDRTNSASYYREAVQQAAAQTSQQLLQPYINIPPTITTPAASRISIYVNRDLDFSEFCARNEEESDLDTGVTTID